MSSIFHLQFKPRILVQNPAMSVVGRQVRYVADAKRLTTVKKIARLRIGRVTK